MKLRFDTSLLRSLLPALPIVLLVLIIGAELSGSEPAGLPAPASAASATDVPSSVRPEFSLASAEAAYSEISERPLFVPNRRPPPPVAVEAARSAMIKGQFVLVGVILAGGNNNIAILREVASGKNRRVKQGKEINGLTLAKVEAKKITLTQGGDSEELSIKIVSAPRSQQASQPGGGMPEQTANPVTTPSVVPVMPAGSGGAPPALRRSAGPPPGRGYPGPSGMPPPPEPPR